MPTDERAVLTARDPRGAPRWIHVLCIGVGSYSDPGLAPLRAAARDAATLYRGFAEVAGGRVQATLSHDPTVTTLRHDLEETLARVSPDDVAIVYYAGHGTEDRITASDTALDRLEATSVAMAELAAAFERCRARVAVFVLDCCHSGAIVDLLRPRAPSPATFGGRGRVLLAASARDAPAYEAGERGLVVQAFLDVFGARERSTIDLLEGLHEVRRAVSERARRGGRVQDPVLHGDAAGVSIPTLRFEPRARRDGYDRIKLPLALLPRAELVRRARDTLLSTEPGQPMCVQGMGGGGKTVVARMLCDDPQVQEAFPDGIVWVTQGPRPSVAGWLVATLELMGEGAAGTSEAIHAERLAAALGASRSLLVVDDVWRRDDLRAFLAPRGAPSRTLFTSRHADLARACGARLIRVPPLEPEEGSELLRLLSDGADGHGDDARRRQVVRRLGGHPQALVLAAARLREEGPRAWAHLRSEQLLPRDLDRTWAPSERAQSLTVNLGLSLDALDPTDRRRFEALAGLPRGGPLPRAAIVARWREREPELRAAEAEGLLHHLADRALLAADDAHVTLHPLLP